MGVPPAPVDRWAQGSGALWLGRRNGFVVLCMASALGDWRPQGRSPPQRPHNAQKTYSVYGIPCAQLTSSILFMYI